MKNLPSKATQFTGQGPRSAITEARIATFELTTRSAKIYSPNGSHGPFTVKFFISGIRQLGSDYKTSDFHMATTAATSFTFKGELR